jgi:malate dehydrogenase (oxaloacetate-decarboxylating)
MQKADIVVATTGMRGLIDPGKVRKGQIIFALSNPYPEITPEAARAAGAILAADGRSVNNLLGYPGIWRGTLDAKARKINYEMLKAAALAIAGLTLWPGPLSSQGLPSDNWTTTILPVPIAKSLPGRKAYRNIS